jgi:threonyl-tRNA synthetase
MDQKTLLHRNDLKNREFDKEASQDSHLERAPIVHAQGASEDENFEKKPTPSKTYSSDCFGIHQSAAECLAHAALDLFPDTLLLGGRGTSQYFYYDLQFPFPFQKQNLSLIEERMIRLMKTPAQAKKREMLASNAAELFISRHQNLLAEKLKKIDGIVPIYERADFFDYCPFPFSLSWPHPAYIKLFGSEDIVHEGRKITRIVGAMSSDKGALKTLLKNPSPLSFNHARFASHEKLFYHSDEGQWIWLPKGEILRQILLEHWKKIVYQEKFQCISTFYPDHADPDAALLSLHQECFLKTGYDKLAEVAYFPMESHSDFREGLFETKSGFVDRLTQFSTEENFLQSCISSLHFILEMPRILGFEFQLTLGLSTAKGLRGGHAKQINGHRVLQAVLEKSGLNYVVENDYRSGSKAWIEVKLSDALGRLWNGPFMSVPMHAQVPTVVCSMFGTMERFVGLMLERCQGVLPLWLAPEQARLIPLSKDARHYAGQIHRTLKNAGIRSEIDTQDTDLGSRLYQAIAQKIPFAVIMGDREIQTGDLVVRAHGSQQEERMNVDALCKCIKNK